MKKVQIDVAECGRSMVEMLGVLAIIGVLTVGGIAGFQKAMMKYKLNRQSDQINQIISAGLRYRGKWSSSEDLNITHYLIALGEIPDEMVRSNITSTIYDIFNSGISFWYTTKEQRPYMQLSFALNTSKGDSYSLDICRNFLLIAKQYHAEIRNVEIISYDTGSWSGESFNGDANCKYRCIYKASINDLNNACINSIKNKISPHLKITWYE